MKTPPTKRPRKLLKAKLGMGALTIVSCAGFPGCNLLPPPPCDDAGNYYCPEPDAGTDAGNDAAVRDAGSQDAGALDAAARDDAGAYDAGAEDAAIGDDAGTDGGAQDDAGPEDAS